MQETWKSQTRPLRNAERWNNQLESKCELELGTLLSGRLAPRTLIIIWITDSSFTWRPEGRKKKFYDCKTSVMDLM